MAKLLRTGAARSKSSDAFRTIGEVSDELDVPKHVLRFWEGKFPQLKPMKRGGGRRFYRPEDVALLRGIHRLLHSAGYTIKGVQRILREQGVDAVKAAWHDDTKGKGPTDSSPIKRQPTKSPELSAELRKELQAIAAEVDAALAVARGLTAPTTKEARAATKPRRA